MLACVLVATGCTRGGASSPTAAPATSATSPATITPLPIQPTGGLVSGALVYATDTAVYLLPRGGPVRRVASTPSGVLDLAISGRYVGWIEDGSPVAIGFYDMAGGRWRVWRAPDDQIVTRTLGVARGRFVVVSEGEDNRMLTFDAGLVIEGAEPASTPLRGRTTARLVAAGGDRVLVATAEGTGPRGGPETVHDVAPDGRMTRLFRDGDGLPEAEVPNLAIGNAGLSADGTRLVYGTGLAGADCTLWLTVAVRDLAAGREIPTRAPTLGDDVFTAVDAVTTGGDGRLVVGFTTEIGGCAGEDRAAAYALSGDRWTLVAQGAEWAATSSDGRLATKSISGDLHVAGRRIATGVARAVWSPV